MKFYNQSLAFLAMLVLVVAAVSLSGCTGSGVGGTTFQGKDIFDPAKFSMARYVMAANESGVVSYSDFIVTSALNEKDGDRLTSQEIHGNDSVKTDVWIRKDRTAATNVLITAINSSNLIITGGFPPFNMTVADEAWNPLEATYQLVGKATVDNRAGHFDNCSVYGAERQIGYGDELINYRVYYFLHPSSPVPVHYLVEMPAATYEYDLQSVYGPNDRDSTPERVIQAFFDSLDQGDASAASGYVVTYDSADHKFKALSGEAYRDFLEGTGAMYGDSASGVRVQYVLTTHAVPAQQTGGRDMVTASWTSVQYQPGTLTAIQLTGKLNVVNIGGHWKIVG